MQNPDTMETETPKQYSTKTLLSVIAQESIRSEIAQPQQPTQKTPKSDSSVIRHGGSGGSGSGSGMGGKEGEETQQSEIEDGSTPPFHDPNEQTDTHHNTTHERSLSLSQQQQIHYQPRQTRQSSPQQYTQRTQHTQHISDNEDIKDSISNGSIKGEEQKQQKKLQKNSQCWSQCSLGCFALNSDAILFITKEYQCWYLLINVFVIAIANYGFFYVFNEYLRLKFSLNPEQVRLVLFYFFCLYLCLDLLCLFVRTYVCVRVSVCVSLKCDTYTIAKETHVCFFSVRNCAIS